MKHKKLSIIVIAIIAIILCNVTLPVVSYASAAQLSTTQASAGTGNPNSNVPNPSDEEAFGIDLGTIVDVAMGFLTYPFKLKLVVPGLVANLVLTELASVGSNKIEVVTLEDILFNRLAIVDANVFSTKTANGEAVSNVIAEIRDSIASWYYVFRNLALVVSVASMLYIGLRIVIDNAAEQRSKYKQMLMNWVVGFVLIFVLHYIIIFVININTALVTSMAQAQPNANPLTGRDYMTQVLTIAFSPSFVQGWGACIMYSILMVMTFSFLMLYIKRMLMISFLVMIAPLITMTYAIDKAGNSRSEALNQWVKEFCYNVLIQPFHCMVYLVFAGTAMKMMYGNGTPSILDFGSIVFAIICVLCIFIGDKMVRTIFGFNKSSSIAKKIFTGNLIMSVVSNVKEIRKANTTEEEEEPVDLMPSGESTEKAIAQQLKLVDDKQKEEKDDSNNAQANSQKNSSPSTEWQKSSMQLPSGVRTKENKLSQKMPPMIRDIGTAYIGEVKDSVGYSTYEKYQEKQKKRAEQKAMKPILQQKELSEEEFIFLLASQDYQREMKLSRRELARKTEAIEKTSYKNLKDTRDIIYKNHINKMKNLLTKQGEKNPTIVMKEIILGTEKQEQEEKRQWLN